MRLIDADALKMEFPKDDDWDYPVNSNSLVCELIDAQPTIKPERKTGKWIKLDMHPHLADHKCTVCGESAYVPTCMGEPMYAYCPNCGADMRGDTDA